MSCNKPDGTGQVWLQTPGDGTAELPEQLPPSRVCVPTTQGGSPEPRAKPGADPARARWEQQRGKAEGAELSPGTPPELGRHSRKGKEIRCSLVSVHGIFRINSNLSPAPLPSAKQRWERSAAHRKITCGWPWRAEGDGGTVLGSLRAAEAPGQGTRRVPGAAPTLRHPTAPAPPVCPFPNPNLGAKENKDDPNTGNGSGRGLWGFILPRARPSTASAQLSRGSSTTSLSEQLLLHTRSPGWNKCKSNSHSFRRDNFSLIACPYNSSHK